jgi:hypothetical protein
MNWLTLSHLHRYGCHNRGYSLSTVISRGFAFEMLQGLVRVGYATAHRDAVGTEKAKLPHLRITEAGRKAIAGILPPP